MADGKSQQPLTLNQLHNRYLHGLSASLSKPKSHTVTEDGDPHSEMRFDGLSAADQVYGDFPRFDLGTTPSPPLKDREERESVEEAVSKLKDPSPWLHPVAVDSDSPSSIIVHMEHDHIEQKSSKISDKKDDAAKEGSSVSGVAILNSSFQGEDRQTKVKIEGRRRLCRISKDNDGVAGADKIDKEPEFDDLCDFDSPLQMNKTCEESGNAIRDILNDLSSRLEILSIEKRRVLKKVEVMNIPESTGSKINMIEEGEFPEYETATSSNLLSSDFPEDIVELKVGSTGTTVISTHRKMNENAEIKNSICISKDNRPIHKYEVIDSNEHMRPHVKSRFVKEPRAHNAKREEKVSDIDKYMALSQTTVKSMDMKTGKFIELSNEESGEVNTLGNHIDDFTLTGRNGTYRLPGKIATILYPHQREGLKWLWSLHCKGKGGILGDDMGLGKTMQICSYIAGLFHSNLIQRVLIVAPKTLLTHWINELSTVGLSQKTREYFAPCAKTRHYELQYVLQDKGILLTTYDIVRNNTKSLCGDYHYNDDGEENVTWDYMILDEGHLIKNPSTQRAKSLLQIPCYHRIIISGTPLQNNLKELWALFNFSCPELLGDKKEFKEKYENFINRGNEKNACDREKRIGSSVAQDLRDRIQPYFLRRLKSEVFADDSTLSKKNEIIVWLKLTQCQRRLYEAFLNSEIVVSAFDGSPLAAITILKKICDHPLLLTKRAAEDVLEGMDTIVGQEDHRVAEKLAQHVADVAERFDIIENHDISCKITFIMALLGNLIPEGHNVLIFSQTRKMLNLIQESLISNHYKYMRIDGTTKASDRAKIVKDFQEGRGSPIFLLTSQVGGLGLTLTNADRVIVVDPAWNPSTDNQSVDRAYRIGQKKDVIVYRLMTCGTVEEKIYRKQVFKGGLFRSATEHKEQIRYFSQQDLRDLFCLPKEGFDVSLTQKQLLEEHDNQHIMEESLKEHVKFLESLNIAGISQHSLLFSKAAPVQAVEIDEEAERLRGSKFVGNASARSSAEQVVDGAHYAFNPKDVKKFQGNSNTGVREPSEFEIRQSINRFSQIIANEAAVLRLPDKGEKIHNQIAALTRQLDQMRMAKAREKEVIEL